MLLRRRSTVGSTPHATRLDRRRLRAMRASDRRAQAAHNVLYEAIAQQSPQAQMATLIGLAR